MVDIDYNFSALDPEDDESDVIVNNYYTKQWLELDVDPFGNLFSCVSFKNNVVNLGPIWGALETLDSAIGRFSSRITDNTLRTYPIPSTPDFDFYSVAIQKLTSISFDATELKWDLTYDQIIITFKQAFLRGQTDLDVIITVGLPEALQTSLSSYLEFTPTHFQSDGRWIQANDINLDKFDLVYTPDFLTVTNTLGRGVNSENDRRIFSVQKIENYWPTFSHAIPVVGNNSFYANQSSFRPPLFATSVSLKSATLIHYQFNSLHTPMNVTIDRSLTYIDNNGSLQILWSNEGPQALTRVHFVWNGGMTYYTQEYHEIDTIFTFTVPNDARFFAGYGLSIVQSVSYLSRVVRFPRHEIRPTHPPVAAAYQLGGDIVLGVLAKI